MVGTSVARSFSTCLTVATVLFAAGCGDGGSSNTGQVNNGPGAGGSNAGAAGSSQQTGGSSALGGDGGATAGSSGNGGSGTGGMGATGGIAGAGGQSGSQQGGSAGAGAGGMGGSAGSGGIAGSAGNSGTAGSAGTAGSGGFAGFVCQSLVETGSPITAQGDSFLLESKGVFARVGDDDTDTVLVCGRTYAESPGPVPGITSHLSFAGWGEDWPTTMGPWLDDSSVAGGQAAVGTLRDGTFPFAFLGDQYSPLDSHGLYFSPFAQKDMGSSGIGPGYPDASAVHGAIRTSDDSSSLVLYSRQPIEGGELLQLTMMGTFEPVIMDYTLGCATGPMVGSMVEVAPNVSLVASSTSLVHPNCLLDNSMPGPPAMVQVLKYDTGTLPTNGYTIGSAMDPVVEWVKITARSDGAWLFYRRINEQGAGLTVQQLDLDGQPVGEPFKVLDNLYLGGKPGVDRMLDGFAIMYIDDTGQVPKLRISVYNENGQLAAETFPSVDIGYPDTVDVISSKLGDRLLAAWTSGSFGGSQNITVARFSCVQAE